ncbi:MAG: outer membrane lipoprotein chaperone LolA [Pseudomonadota bacterium]
MRRLQKIVLAAALILVNSAFASPGLDALDNFFNNVQTFEARFGQIVLDETLESVDDGQGTVYIKRPGLFRWDYEPPEAQEIVGDGFRVWLHDIELEQVTVRDQATALGRTPAILLAGGGDLEADYFIDDIGTQGRFDWVNLIPKDEESNFSEVRIGFEDNRLRLMELLDTLGQRTRITFVDLKENQPISDTVFDFIPPPGVDVIDESEE